ncbi:hypothetical protein J1N10_15240 [Carboxylicivirga sp. A043]|uniref:NADase-type glycan-binding domain-containing protein n=1 Tax=Carboxylicivirga litoralis TaxID=2816963 RepID=UPI0021CB771F|nr:hypothetical protein [Carboxylicivirga sp. A043]MCU4157330.1 hypothetical protein [Carboxylicivirga sp. A043]
MLKKGIFIVLCFINLNVVSQDLEHIKSRQIDKSSDYYESSINGYRTNEFWCIWTMPMGNAFSSSELKPQGNIDYSISNVMDYDLTTSWIEGKTDYGVGEKFGFTFNFPESTEYGGAYQFYGIVNVFNRYCKSLEVWQQNSRIRNL